MCVTEPTILNKNLYFVNDLAYGHRECFFSRLLRICAFLGSLSSAVRKTYDRPVAARASTGGYAFDYGHMGTKKINEFLVKTGFF